MMVVIAWLDLVFWGVCFWWMHRISSRQDSLLGELHRMTKRIEHLSKAEHELIREVHPQVHEIKDKVEHVQQVVSQDKKPS